MLENFEGIQGKLADNWFSIIDANILCKQPINYLEIGVQCGGNFVSVGLSYGMHSGSKLYAVDPWEEFGDTHEQKAKQSMYYNNFMRNIHTFGLANKSLIYRGFSNKIVPNFPDKYFHIIYIDGNNKPEYVLEDAVIAFNKLSDGGIMVFNGYDFANPHLAKRGIDAFVSGYQNLIKVSEYVDKQMIVIKK